jgi:RNA polymerase sigma-70 factor (ECF subfamily)
MVYGWWRQRRRMPLAIADHLKSLIDEADDALTAAARREVQAALDHCLDQLAPHARQLIAQRYEQGLRIKDMARQLERKATAVRVQLFRIRQQLKQCVEGQLAEGGVSA